MRGREGEGEEMRGREGEEEKGGLEWSWGRTQNGDGWMEGWREGGREGGRETGGKVD